VTIVDPNPGPAGELLERLEAVFVRR